ncbi:hypothetical protein MKMG_00454 [Methanogenium sp. MK-MG]|nr:hypothetical protein MKMG_00454 [Methanogenium sp. MK-MG]
MCYWINDMIEILHRQIRGETGAHSVMPVRTWESKIHSGKYRQGGIPTSMIIAVMKEMASKQHYQSSKKI